MIAEKDATWEVKLVEHLDRTWRWVAWAKNDTGTHPDKHSTGTFLCLDKESAEEHFKKYAKLNNITKYKIVGEE